MRRSLAARLAAATAAEAGPATPVGTGVAHAGSLTGACRRHSSTGTPGFSTRPAAAAAGTAAAAAPAAADTVPVAVPHRRTPPAWRSAIARASARLPLSFAPALRAGTGPAQVEFFPAAKGGGSPVCLADARGSLAPRADGAVLGSKRGTRVLASVVLDRPGGTAAGGAGAWPGIAVGSEEAGGGSGSGRPRRLGPGAGGGGGASDGGPVAVSYRERHYAAGTTPAMAQALAGGAEGGAAAGRAAPTPPAHTRANRPDGGPTPAEDAAADLLTRALRGCLPATSPSAPPQVSVVVLSVDADADPLPLAVMAAAAALVQAGVRGAVPLGAARAVVSGRWTPARSPGAPPGVSWPLAPARAGAAVDVLAVVGPRAAGGGAGGAGGLPPLADHRAGHPRIVLVDGSARGTPVGWVWEALDKAVAAADDGLEAGLELSAPALVGRDGFGGGVAAGRADGAVREARRALLAEAAAAAAARTALPPVRPDPAAAAALAAAVGPALGDALDRAAAGGATASGPALEADLAAVRAAALADLRARGAMRADAARIPGSGCVAFGDVDAAWPALVADALAARTGLVSGGGGGGGGGGMPPPSRPGAPGEGRGPFDARPLAVSPHALAAPPALGSGGPTGSALVAVGGGVRVVAAANFAAAAAGPGSASSRDGGGSGGGGAAATTTHAGRVHAVATVPPFAAGLLAPPRRPRWARDARLSSQLVTALAGAMPPVLEEEEGGGRGIGGDPPPSRALAAAPAGLPPPFAVHLAADVLSRDGPPLPAALAAASLALASAGTPLPRAVGAASVAVLARSSGGWADEPEEVVGGGGMAERAGRRRRAAATLPARPPPLFPPPPTPAWSTRRP